MKRNIIIGTIHDQSVYNYPDNISRNLTYDAKTNL